MRNTGLFRVKNICKTLKGEAIPLEAGLRAFNNAADGSLRLARRVKIDEKKGHHPICCLGKR